MDPSNNQSRTPVSTEDMVTGPAHLDSPPANSPADNNMSEAEQSTAPSRAAYRQALGYAETYRRALRQSGVFIQTAEETFNVDGNPVRSVKPEEVCIPELETLRAICDQKQTEINGVKEQLEEAKDFHRLSLEARANDIASLNHRLSTVESRCEDLLESLSQEKGLVAAQAAEIGKLTAMCTEAEDQREQHCEVRTRAVSSAWSWRRDSILVKAENQRLREVIQNAQSITEIREQAQQRTGGVPSAVPAVNRDNAQLQAELAQAQETAAAAQAAERDAVQALGREGTIRQEMGRIYRDQTLQLDRVRRDATAREEMAARVQAVVEEQLAEAQRKLEETRRELSNARDRLEPGRTMRIIPGGESHRRDLPQAFPAQFMPIRSFIYFPGRHSAIEAGPPVSGPPVAGSPVVDGDVVEEAAQEEAESSSDDDNESEAMVDV